MEILYMILGTVLTALFFLNIKNAADLLCRIIGGISLLIVYNTAFPFLPGVGINLVSGTVAGLLGLPGVLLIICLGLFCNIVSLLPYLLHKLFKHKSVSLGSYLSLRSY